jgi:hypothetical protein
VSLGWPALCFQAASMVVQKKLQQPTNTALGEEKLEEIGCQRIFSIFLELNDKDVFLSKI